MIASLFDRLCKLSLLIFKPYCELRWSVCHLQTSNCIDPIVFHKVCHIIQRESHVLQCTVINFWEFENKWKTSLEYVKFKTIIWKVTIIRQFQLHVWHLNEHPLFDVIRRRFFLDVIALARWRSSCLITSINLHSILKTFWDLPVSDLYRHREDNQFSRVKNRHYLSVNNFSVYTFLTP